MFEVDPQVKHFFSSGVYAKEMHLPAGYVATTHKHNFDHLSILAQGTAIMNGITYHAPDVLTILAGVEHSITALTDTIWYCIHATDETDESKIDAILIQNAKLS